MHNAILTLVGGLRTNYSLVGIQWRFYVGARGNRPPNLAQPLPQFLIGSIVISLSRCCLPNDEGPTPCPQYFFPRTACTDSDVHMV